MIEGMPHDRVMRIRQDERGFLWFGTADGLARFDGRSIVGYGSADGLTDQLVWDVLPGPQAYWIATDNVGLFRFRPDSVPARFEPMPIEGHEGTVYSLHRDATGTVWAATHRGLYRGVASGDELQWSHVPLARDPSLERRAIALAEDSSGSVWVGGGNGLHRVCSDGTVVDHTAALAGVVTTVLSIAFDGRHVLAAGDRGIVALLMPQRCGEEALTLPAENRRLRAFGFGNVPIRSVLRSSSGDLWIGAIGKLVRTGPSGFALDDATSQDLADATVRSFLEDRLGNIWAATDVGGALRFPPTGFTTFVRRHGLAHDYATRLQADPRGPNGPGGVIATTLVDGFTHLHEDQATPSRSPLPAALIPPSSDQYPLLDHRGEWWIPTVDGVWRFDATQRFEELGRAQPRKIYRRADGLPGDVATYVWEDARHGIWILCNAAPHAWLVRWDRITQKFTPVDWKAVGLKNVAIYALADGAEGDVWMALANGALARWSAGRLRVFTAPELTLRRPVALHRGPSGTLWVGSSVTGIVRIDNAHSDAPRFNALALSEPLASAGVTCLVEGLDDRLFIGTARGVFRLDVASGRLRRYTVADGLASNEIVTCERDAAGRLWFATSHGVSRFEPGVDRPLPKAEVYVTRLRAGGEDVPLPALGTSSVGPLTIGPESTALDLSLISLGLAPGDRSRFQYRWGNDWSNVNELDEVVFPSLAPGKHRLELRALNGDGIPSSRPAVVQVEVIAPLWKRNWVRGVALLSVLLLTTIAYRMRVRRLVQRERAQQLDATNRELERRVEEGIQRVRQSERMAAYGQLVAGVAHEVRHPVFALRTAAYMIGQRSVPGLEAPLAAMRTETDRITRLVDELLVFAREPALVCSPTEVGELLQEVAASCRAVQGDDASSIVVEVSPDAGSCSLDRDRITQVLVNLVENARRHGAARTIRLIAKRSDEPAAVRLIVADDGRGISPEMRPHIFEPFFTGGRGTGLGLAIVERLVQAHGGTIDVDSHPGAGARFTITLPTNARPT